MSELRARLDVPLGDRAPRAARRSVLAVLAGWGFADSAWLDGVSVVVSELVTNAVVHGGGCIELAVEAHGRQVTVSVADGSSVVPRPRRADHTGGRGLRMIESLSTRWGIQDHEGGKRVWVELTPCPELDHEPVDTDAR